MEVNEYVMNAHAEAATRVTQIAHDMDEVGWEWPLEERVELYKQIVEEKLNRPITNVVRNG